MISKLQSLVYAGAPFAMDRWLTSMLDKCGSPFAVVRAREGERGGGLLAVYSTFARICLYSTVMTVPACAFQCNGQATPLLFPRPLLPNPILYSVLL
jgi:hypothetical protein